MLKRFFGSSSETKKDISNIVDDQSKAPTSPNNPSPTTSNLYNNFNPRLRKVNEPSTPSVASSTQQSPQNVPPLNLVSYASPTPVQTPSTPTTSTPTEVQRRLSMMLVNQQQKDSPTAASHILLTERGASMLHLSAHHLQNSLATSLEGSDTSNTQTHTTELKKRTPSMSLGQSALEEVIAAYEDTDSEEEDEPTTPRISKRSSLTLPSPRLTSGEPNNSNSTDDVTSILQIPPFKRSSIIMGLHNGFTPGTPMSARSLASMLDQFIDEPQTTPAIQSPPNNLLSPETGEERRHSIDSASEKSLVSKDANRIHGSAYLSKDTGSESPSPTLLEPPQRARHKRTISVDSSRVDEDQKSKPVQSTSATPTIIKTKTTTNLKRQQIDSPVYKSYKFTDEEGREYQYLGTIIASTNEMHGRGELKYPNKTIYEGDFDHGKRHGFGKMIFPSLSPKKSPIIAIGQWENDAPSGLIPWKITYEDEIMEYWGYIKLKTKSIGKTMLTIDGMLLLTCFI